MLSIIIPVLNEAETIAELLIHLSENLSREHETELILVDRGSTDGTQEIISAFEHTRVSKPVRLIQSEKGRAKHMTRGAQMASGEILYIIHADPLPHNNPDNYIIPAVEKGNPAGCFRMKCDHNH